MTEQERREHFAFLNGVAADMKESRKEIIELLESIKAEIKQEFDYVRVGCELFEKGEAAGYRIAYKIIEKHIKEYKE